MQFNSYTEWDPLRSMMVADINVDNKDIQSDIFALKGKHLTNLVQRTKTMLDQVCEVLDKQGVNIVRPDPKKFTGTHRFPCLNIRDRLGVIGTKLIMYSCTDELKGLEKCFTTPDHSFPDFSDDTVFGKDDIKNDVPYLEGANLIRCGSIIFSTLADTGNTKGIDHLQKIIGDQFKIVTVTTVKNHLDAHINFVNEGLMLYDARMDISEIKPHIPDVKAVPILYERIADQPELIWPDIQDDDVENTNLLMSNTITINPETVLCLNAQYDDIEFFHSNGIKCITIDWPEQWIVNAGLHCFTVDLERDGKLTNYLTKSKYKV